MVMSGVTDENTVGRTKKPSIQAVGSLGPAGEEGRPLADALVDVGPDPVPLHGGDQGSEPGGFVERVARGVRLGGGPGQVLGLGQPLPRDQHAGQGAAGLAGVGVALGHPVRHGLGQVGVGQEHVGRLAAELEGHPLDRGGGHLGDPPAGAGRTGERDHVDVPVGGDGLAHDRADSGDEVEDAGRGAELVEDLGQDEGVERGHLTGLDHHGAAGGQGRCHLGGDLVQRIVPRGDGARRRRPARAPPGSCPPPAPR